jgi:phosphoribosylanthranilate isomerase
MIDGIRFKVCGLTSLVDAEFADKCGADYLGFNLFPPSPRFISLEQFKGMASLLPDRKTVAVTVEPAPEELKAMLEGGFDYFQIHFRTTIAPQEIEEWSEIVGRNRLWLAPKLPAGVDISPDWLKLSDHCLMDTYAPDKFGGTGKTGDWAKFARHRATYPQTRWMLAGGLTPDNVEEAVRASGARFVDVNSGVESAPGVKDEAQLKRFVVALHRSRTQ